eukprot:m.233993 g.233993  ORF g.233993 m.233993 type:complete len:84 (-) comp16030_c0_seq30:1250-1501(-)
MESVLVHEATTLKRRNYTLTSTPGFVWALTKISCQLSFSSSNPKHSQGELPSTPHQAPTAISTNIICKNIISELLGKPCPVFG